MEVISPFIVYSIATLFHIIKVKGSTFSDELETEYNEHLTINESLLFLNSGTDICFMCGQDKETYNKKGSFSRLIRCDKNSPLMCPKCYIKRFRRTHREQENEKGKNFKKTLKGLITQAKAEAKKRGLLFEIPPNIFEKLRNKPCFYCSKPLENKYGCGLDRIDNSKNYVLGNVIPCCPTCNVTRGNNYTVQEMRVMIKALLEYRKLNTTEKLVTVNG